ncbi:MAG TPA: radical SAM family heme chaperone HemW [Paracoccaceae bacterium]|nr:radical SAM family heme chaperone HemW [Paracoccaceae bacterium]
MKHRGPVPGENRRFGLYVHWPFCESKCPYCDFNSHVGGVADPAVWAKAYRREIGRLAGEAPGRRLDSIFFGGGTPSLMDPAVVDEVIGAARQAWGFSNGIEITMEANPGSADASRFAGYRAAGVNRMSVGVQALRDADLQALGRRHNVREALAAVDLAMALFERVSLDLIYARQSQRPEEWSAELRRTLGIGTTHLSLYQLTIEPGTAFAARQAAGGLRGMPDEERAAEMYEITQELCSSAGLPAYEVSNHAVPGAECRHNLIYWTAGDWIGLGPGAHGRLTNGGKRLATETPSLPSEWLSGATAGSGESLRTVLTAQDQAREYLLSGLRLREGIPLARFETVLGRPVDRQPVDDLVDWGMLHATSGASPHLRPTQRGFALLDAVIRHLDAAWIG